jgi:hypothetical protein
VRPGELAALVLLTVWILVFLRALASLRGRRPLEPREAGPGPARVWACVPARDEVEVIDACVDGLLAQGPSLGAVVIVDDGSTDGTSERLAARSDPRLSVRAGRGPGPGECGKPAALRDAVAELAPDAPWLLFVDADVRLEPGAVDALLAEAEARGADLVSGFPRFELGSAVEHVVLPAVGALLVARHPPPRVEDPEDGLAFANGQVILVRREVYARANGHGAVVHEILEDVRLAERVKAVGGRLALADLRRLASTRMYSSWAELREGWTKNLYPLLGGRLAPCLGWAGLTLGLGAAPVWLLLLAPGPLGLGAALAVMGMQAASRALGGTPARWAPLAPLGAVAVAGLALSSAALHRRRAAIPWKGRRYAPGPPPRDSVTGTEGDPKS